MFGLLCFSAPGVGEATTEEAGLPLTPLWPPPNWSVRGHRQTGLCPREFEKEGSGLAAPGQVGDSEALLVEARGVLEANVVHLRSRDNTSARRQARSPAHGVAPST